MITYKVNEAISPEQMAKVFQESGIKRPTSDLARLKKMIDQADLLITAWDQNELVGLARSLTDFAYCCYLSDLAVHSSYQKSGVGKALFEQTRVAIGDQCSLVLLSAPGAMDYYPKIGMDQAENAFVIKRKQ
ncbi:GNAT family N-acetyltransferase [Halalkalibacter alkalisediminis]|uniref:GNAT family N-acetyltransferase n=1 Tax=Halalkalibacter alkalisediminis TaxID=935616 RepID=A0ABV6NCI6_9BACI|nr:GNAT family N-acetyltransferase [Halalkalibacter alkalisediminis]